MDLLGFITARQDEIVFLFIQHAQLVLLSITIATVIALTLALLVESSPIAREITVSLAAAGLTVPSIALFLLLVPLFGFGLVPSVVGLTLYAIYPILLNTLTGFGTVPPAVIEAATGVGMPSRRRLALVRLPMAWPVILAGVRTASALLCGIAAVATYVQGPGFGSYIFTGLSRTGAANALEQLLTGIIGIVVVAATLELIYAVIARLTISRGIRA